MAALVLVGCARAGASDVDDAGRPLTSPTELSVPPTEATTPSTTSSVTIPTATASTTTPSTTIAPPPPRVDCDVARCIALTFDDGPAATTPRLLDVLAAKGVPATFFVLGVQVDGLPEVVARAQAEGHQIENHTYSHPTLTETTLDAAEDEVRRGADAIEAVTGRRPSYLRPPRGETSAALRQALGLPEVLWSVDPQDWLTKDTGETILRVVRDARPGGIVLLHDIYETSVDAVAPIIDHLRSQGYTFVTVSELLGPDPEPGQVHRGRPAG